MQHLNSYQMEDSIEFLDNHLQGNHNNNSPKTHFNPSIFTNSHKLSQPQPLGKNNLNVNTQAYLFSKNNLNSDSINSSNNIPLSSIISPKNNRRLMHSYNTTSQQSLAYSNSTYRNKLTERSPPLFNLDYFHIHDQNVNTITSPESYFNKGEITFNINRGNNKVKVIKFDRITEQSKIQSEGNSFIYNNFSNTQVPFNINTINDGENILNLCDKNQIDKEQTVLELPCFLSHQNSPQNIKFPNKLNTEQKESIEKQTSHSVLNQDSLTIPIKNLYTKHTSSKDRAQHILQKEIVTRRDCQNRQKSYKKQMGIQSNKSSCQKSRKSLLKKQQQQKTNETSKILQNNNKQPQFKSRIKQLEYQLRTTQIEREQLRAKLRITNQLLEERFLSNLCVRCYIQLGQSQKQGEKSSIRDKISVLVEDKMAQLDNSKNLRSDNRPTFKSDCETKQRYQVSLQVSQQKSSFKQRNLTGDDNLPNNLQLQLQYDQAKYEAYFRKEVLTLKQQLSQSLLRNKQSQQMICILSEKEKQTQSMISLLEEKERRFQQIQRPRLLHEINELTHTLNQQKETIDKLQMETNLRNYLQSSHMKSHLMSPQKDSMEQQQLRQSLRTCQLQETQITKQQRQEICQQNNDKNSIQIGQNKMLMTMQVQLDRLKEERNYFQKQYQNSLNLSFINYKLNLKIQDLQNQLHSIKQLIQVDDDITF